MNEPANFVAGDMNDVCAGTLYETHLRNSKRNMHSSLSNLWGCCISFPLKQNIIYFWAEIAVAWGWGGWRYIFFRLKFRVGQIDVIKRYFDTPTKKYDKEVSYVSPQCTSTLYTLLLYCCTCSNVFITDKLSYSMSWPFGRRYCGSLLARQTTETRAYRPSYPALSTMLLGRSEIITKKYKSQISGGRTPPLKKIEQK